MEGEREGEREDYLPHEFKGYTEVVSEVEVVDHVNYVVLVLSVLRERDTTTAA